MAIYTLLAIKEITVLPLSSLALDITIIHLFSQPLLNAIDYYAKPWE